jgi:hypothetical protein
MIVLADLSTSTSICKAILTGLMWCGVQTKDLEETLFWSGRKAEANGRDVQAAREAGRRRYLKMHSP